MRWFTPLGVYLLLLTFAVVLQYRSGTFRVEFAAYPDEPSHYVTGLMIRDYIVSGFAQPPERFAREYYEKYPKVALGHWPPVFYVVEALWMVLFSPSRVSTLLLMAVISSTMGILLFWRLRTLLGTAAGLIAALVLASLPDVQKQTAMVMPEMLVTVFGFLAAICFGRYLETETWRDSLLFGVFASLCILTKGNGWAVVAVPPVAIILARKFGLLRHASLWASPAVIACLCVPWHLYADKYVRHVWTPGDSFLSYATRNAINVWSSVLRAGGPVLFAFACAGAVAVFLIPFIRRARITGEWAAVGALAIGVCSFNTIVPLEIEMRKLVMAVPPLLMFVVAGGTAVSRRLAVSRAWARVLPFVAIVGGFAAQTFTVPVKRPRGLIEAAQNVLLKTDRPATFLISGTAAAEGAFVAEIVMHDDDRRHKVLRAGKLLASSDWNGGHYRLWFSTTNEVFRTLNRHSISAVVLENAPVWGGHHKLLRQTLLENSREWVRTTPPHFSAVEVYYRVTPRSAGRIEGLRISNATQYSNSLNHRRRSSRPHGRV